MKQLNEEVLALGRKKTILSVNDQTVTNNNTTATQNNTAMNANANSLQYQTQIIHRVGSFVSDTNATITLDNTEACETTVRAQATSSGALNMQNGVNIQN